MRLLRTFFGQLESALRAFGSSDHVVNDSLNKCVGCWVGGDLKKISMAIWASSSSMLLKTIKNYFVHSRVHLSNMLMYVVHDE